MGISLEEYAAQHPQEMPKAEREQQQQTIAIKEMMQDRQDEQARIERLKQSVIAQLEQGNAPQFVLYAAIDALGLATHDPDFSDTCKQLLDKVYDGLEQQSLLTDNAAIAAARIADMKADYTARLRRQLTKQLIGYQKIANGLNEALAALNEIDD